MAQMQIRGSTQIMDGTVAYATLDSNLQSIIGAGVTFKASVRIATTANLTYPYSGNTSIDGITTVTGDRILVKNQTTASQNGIWLASGSTWSRAADANDAGEITSGMTCWVNEGSANADSQWLLTTDTNPIVIGTTSLSFTQVSGLGQISAGTGLTKSGNTINFPGGSGLTTNADSVDVNPGKGITINGSQVEAYIGDGLKFNTLGANEVMVKVNVSSPGLNLDSNGLTVLLDSNPGLQLSSGLKIKLDTASQLVLGSGGIKVTATPEFTSVTVTDGGIFSYNGDDEGIIASGYLAATNKLFLYHDTSYRAEIVSVSTNSNRTYTLPDRAGTFALTGDAISNEVPSGTPNNSTVDFTLTNTPVSGTVKVYINGIRQKLTTHYTVSGSTITMGTAPTTGDLIVVDYVK